MDAAITVVSSELDCLFSIKEEHRQGWQVIWARDS